MIDFELGAVQERFADIVWANEPIGSGELVKICDKELNWKKPTTYTVLRKLCEKGLFITLRFVSVEEDICDIREKEKKKEDSSVFAAIRFCNSRCFIHLF